MDIKTRAVKFALATFSPDARERLIRSCHLPYVEEKCILDGEIREKSVQQLASELHLSPEAVKRRRRSAFEQIYCAVHGY